MYDANASRAGWCHRQQCGVTQPQASAVGGLGEACGPASSLQASNHLASSFRHPQTSHRCGQVVFNSVHLCASQAQRAPTFIACMTAGTSPARPPATYAASTLVCRAWKVAELSQDSRVNGAWSITCCRQAAAWQSALPVTCVNLLCLLSLLGLTCTSCPAAASPPCARNSCEYTPMASLYAPRRYWICSVW